MVTHGVNKNPVFKERGMPNTKDQTDIGISKDTPRTTVWQAHRLRRRFILTAIMLSLCCAFSVLFDGSAVSQAPGPGGMVPINPFTLERFSTQQEQFEMDQLMFHLEQYDLSGDPFWLNLAKNDASHLGLELKDCKPLRARCTSDDDCCSKNCDYICYRHP